MSAQDYPGIVNAGMIDEGPADHRPSKEQVERFEIWSVSHDGMAELARQRAGMGPTDFEQYIPKCDRDVFVRWEDYDRLADEIKRLDADACNERAEKESWRAIAETRTRELAEARNASVPGSATVFAAVEAERDRLRAALKDIASHLDESYRPGCLERILGDKARAALSGEPSAHETSGERAADTLSGFVPGTRFIRSKLFRQFLEQGFWHAHHVDLIWRYNGQDVREEADWLKDVWYALLEREKRTAEPPRNYSYHGAYAAEVQSDIAEHKRNAEKASGEPT